MTAADSNLVLRVILGDEPQHSRRAVAWLERQPDNSVLLLDAVLVEVLFILESKRLYAMARSDFMPILLEFFGGAVWCVSALSWRALALYESTRLDYVDCLLAALCEAGEVDAVATFDQALQKRVGQTVV